MKRYLSLSLLLLLLLFCAACGGGGQANAPDGGSGENASPVQAGQDASPENAPPDDGMMGEEPSVAPPADPVDPVVEDEPEERVIDPSKPMVALTFDDGPDETYTDRILDTFVENNALATFFVVGRNVNAFPDVVTRIAEAGCEVGSHSYAHSQLTKLSKRALREDFENADAAIEAATGSAPYLIRPPYGDVNKSVSAIAGRPMICWNVDTEDWKSRDAQTVIDYVQNYGNLDGDVVLFHSIYESTADAIDVLVPWLQEQGYQLVTVTELMSYYYGEWPQPRTTYWNYFNVTARTGNPLPLPEPGELVAQPEDSPASATTPAAPPAQDPPPETPPETQPETQPGEEPGVPSTDPEDPTVPPEDSGTGEVPPDEGGTEPAPGGSTEDGGGDADPGELPDWLL